MSQRRRLTILTLTLMPLLLLAAPARAQSSSSSSDAFVVLTGHLDVAGGETFSDAVIFNGPAVVEGTVRDSVMAFNGDVLITGTVGGDVVALNGRVTVTSGAHVGGDVASQDAPEIAAGTVSGQIRQASGFDANDLQLAFVGRMILWLIATVSSFLLGLALTLWLPRAADALAETSTRRTGASFGFGVLWFFGIPVVGVVLAVTVVAALAGVGLLLGLVLISTVAYSIGVFLFGRRLLPAPRGRFLAFLAGWGILRIAAIVPVLGGIAWTLAVMFGLGAFMLTAFRAARAGAPAAPASTLPSGSSAGATLPPIPPMPS